MPFDTQGLTVSVWVPFRFPGVPPAVQKSQKHFELSVEVACISWSCDKLSTYLGFSLPWPYDSWVSCRRPLVAVRRRRFRWLHRWWMGEKLGLFRKKNQQQMVRRLFGTHTLRWGNELREGPIVISVHIVARHCPVMSHSLEQRKVFAFFFLLLTRKSFPVLKRCVSIGVFMTYPQMFTLSRLKVL